MENNSVETSKYNGDDRINDKMKNAVGKLPPPIDKVYAECFLDDTKLKDFKENPVGLFQIWFQQAFQHAVPEPYIMSLATSNGKGIPSVRPVGLCNVDAKGFYFATNTHSRKVKDLKENPQASVGFYWIKLDRVVRVEGKVVQVEENYEKYFQTWPRSVQIAEHSRFKVGETINERKELIDEMEMLTVKFGEMDTIPFPDQIVTYRIEPIRIEFVQVHLDLPSDRILFNRPDQGESWSCTRLAR